MIKDDIKFVNDYINRYCEETRNCDKCKFNYNDVCNEVVKLNVKLNLYIVEEEEEE